MFQPTTVVNKTRGAHFDVYIGRPSVWGNPFVIGKDGDRATVIRKYEAWIQTQPHLLARLSELQGKRLGCFCAPLPCHGQVLARLADAQCEYTHNLAGAGSIILPASAHHRHEQIGETELLRPGLAA